jgi:isochorismate hydrolase
VKQQPSSETGLLIIDMINPFIFPEAEKLLPSAFQAAERIALFKDRATAAGVPTIYVNDNFGKWRYDFRSLIAHCLETSCNGRSIVELLRPRPDDYFVLKPKCVSPARRSERCSSSRMRASIGSTTAAISPTGMCRTPLRDSFLQAPVHLGSGRHAPVR